MVEKYLHRDEQILAEVSIRNPSLTSIYTDYIYYATNERLLCYAYCLERGLYYSHPVYQHATPEQIYELPYSNAMIWMKQEKKTRWEIVLGGLFLLAIGLSLSQNFKEPIVLLFILLGLPLIAAGFLLGKDAWYQIDSPTMTESERRIWQIPVDAQNADKFYAVVSEKVGRSG